MAFYVVFLLFLGGEKTFNSKVFVRTKNIRARSKNNLFLIFRFDFYKKLKVQTTLIQDLELLRLLNTSITRSKIQFGVIRKSYSCSRAKTMYTDALVSGYGVVKLEMDSLVIGSYSKRVELEKHQTEALLFYKSFSRINFEMSLFCLQKLKQSWSI